VARGVGAFVLFLVPYTIIGSMVGAVALNFFKIPFFKG
jgi:hypothetical protein